ncbi:MAG: hypothetical protein C3F17_01710 [Bradyrhizobiaceae bacterium]|nr:MAG: hypothetical protein C3F17_01710 [Bradyrhizobiaceae bacterium]
MTAATTSRQSDLDLLKTLLVVGMIIAHVIQLLGASGRLSPASQLVSGFVNLISFSGFLMAFGMGVGLSRGGRPSIGARLTPALALLAATWVSSLGYVLLVSREPVTLATLTDLVTLRVLHGYSEFLASFFVLCLGLALLRPAFVAIATNPYWLFFVTVACLAATQVTVSARLPLVGTLIGSRSRSGPAGGRGNRS